MGRFNGYSRHSGSRGNSDASARNKQAESYVEETYPGMLWKFWSLTPAGCFRAYVVESVPVVVTFDVRAVCLELMADLESCVGGRKVGSLMPPGWALVKLTDDDRATIASALLGRKGTP